MAKYRIFKSGIFWFAERQNYLFGPWIKISPIYSHSSSLFNSKEEAIACVNEHKNFYKKEEEQNKRTLDEKLDTMEYL